MSARDEILNAAVRLFGEAGFDAATTREIAEISGVNKALIHYHFKSKEALFGSVIEKYYSRLNGALMRALEREGTLKDRMARLIDAYVDFLSSNLDFTRIVQRESAGGRHGELIRGHLDPMFRAGTALIQEAYPGTRSGDLAAHQLLISFAGMISSWFTYSDTIEQLLGKDPLSEEELEERKRHLRRMLDVVEKTVREETT
ncbi:MAG: TetR/AcrR family transcriptional regulator [bacterium]